MKNSLEVLNGKLKWWKKIIKNLKISHLTLLTLRNRKNK